MARRNECVLVCGPSGCGKTSLFRICAGLQSIDGKRIILPERHHLLFIPQRSYLPLGTLRFQALFLLEDRSNINERDLLQLFQSVNLQYLLERHTLDTVSDIANSSFINRARNIFSRFWIGL
jgi:putative ATP-binding cassette transporter